MSLGPLQDEFRKHTQEAAQMAAFRQHAVDMGMKGDALVAGVIDNSAAATKEAQGSISEMAEKQAKQQADDALFLAVLNDLENAIRDGEQRMNVLEQQLVETYGENWAEKIYEAEFGKSADGLTHEQKLDSLAEKYLDDDGNVKPEYSDKPIALYLAERYDVNKMRGLMFEGKIQEAHNYMREDAASEGQGMSAVYEGMYVDDRDTRALALQLDNEVIEKAQVQAADMGGLTMTFGGASVVPDEKLEETAEVQAVMSVVPEMNPL